RLIPASNAGMGLSLTHLSDEERALRAEAELSANDSAIAAMMARLNALSAEGEAPAIKVKVTATEAKRAWQEEQQQDEGEDRPMRWSARGGVSGADAREDKLPDWWPASLREVTTRGGTNRGHINHKFLERIDLDAVAKGVSLKDEGAGRIAEGVLEPGDEMELLIDELRDVFELEPLGPALLAQRHTVRREVPFRIGVRVRHLVPDSPAAEEIVMMQGVIDLIY